MKKLIAGILSVLTVLTPVFAEAEPTGSPETEPEETAEEEEVQEEEYAVDLNTEYAVLIELGSGTVLFDKNGNEPGDPASLTKIMTVLLAAEELKAGDSLTMSSAAFQSYSHDQGVLWIQEGETLTVKDCEYASMLASANDTAAMLAEGIAGDIKSFVTMMNQRAEAFGMSGTHFENPFGTAAAGQYSTAHDLAVLTRQAVKNEVFKAIFEAPSYTIGATNKQAQSRTIVNDCELLPGGSYAYKDAKGGKIGSTAANGFALAASASRGETDLIAVVMHEENAEAAYRDISALFDYGFENTQTITITPEDIGTKTVSVTDGKQHVAEVVFSADSSFNILLPKSIEREDITSEIILSNENSSDPEHITGRVVFLLNGEEIGSSPLVREVIKEPEKEKKDPVQMLKDGFDIVSVILLAIMILRPIAKYLKRFLEPPK